jgi:hypothetical protein
MNREQQLDIISMSNQQQQQQQQKKKCHGNRRDQRFRKKRRARGIKPEKIEKQLARQKQIWNKNDSTKNNDVNNTTTTTNHSITKVPILTNISNQTAAATTTTTTTGTPSIKRKRDLSSYELNSNQITEKSLPTTATTTTNNTNGSLSPTQPLVKKKKIMIEPSMIVNYRFVFFFILYTLTLNLIHILFS